MAETGPNATSQTMLSGDAVWSFRDPAGQLVAIDNRILRIVKPAFRPDVEALLKSPVIQKAIQQGSFVKTTPLETAGATVPNEVRRALATHRDAEVLEHERIWFPSFPSEWPPEMLHAAGTLTLQLADSLIDGDLGLKDGTPFNVLYRGPQPVFVDVLSIERRDPHNPVWLPYAQFVRTFLLPLLASRRLSMPIGRIFLANREGLEPEDIYAALGWGKRLRPPYLELVSMPTWLGSRAKNKGEDSIYKSRRVNSVQQTRFVLHGILRRLKKTLNRLQPVERQSSWSEYRSMTHYSDGAMKAKSQFVQDAVAQTRGKTLLDLGCNTGRFSVACAEAGMNVVAADYDEAVVGSLWREASARRLCILPLVVNIAQPTPPTGWRNRECPSFLERARGSFDLVLMLALIHHLLVTDRVPLPEILRLASELTRDAAVIEFVPVSDPMFRRLLRGREELHRDFNQESFETACSQFFRITRKEQLAPGSRCLYLLRK